MESQVFPLLLSELKHEVGREAFDVSLDSLVQVARGDAVKLRQIGIEYDFLTAEVVDEGCELFRHEQGSGCWVWAGFSLGGGFFGRHGRWSAGRRGIAD